MKNGFQCSNISKSLHLFYIRSTASKEKAFSSTRLVLPPSEIQWKDVKSTGDRKKRAEECERVSVNTFHTYDMSVYFSIFAQIISECIAATMLFEQCRYSQ